MVKKNEGQSLIEVMVALFVLTMGLLGVLSLLSQSVFVSETVSQQTTATYLAEEGLEITKNIVDHDIYGNRENVAGFTGWAPGGEDPTFKTGGNFEVDYSTCNSLASPASQCVVPAFSGDFLNFNPSTGLYSYAGPVPTGFTRRISVVWNASTPNQMEVDSIVNWTTTGGVQTVDLEDYFYNWQPS